MIRFWLLFRENGKISTQLLSWKSFPLFMRKIGSLIYERGNSSMSKLRSCLKERKKEILNLMSIIPIYPLWSPITSWNPHSNFPSESRVLNKFLPHLEYQESHVLIRLFQSAFIIDSSGSKSYFLYLVSRKSFWIMIEMRRQDIKSIIYILPMSD